MHKHREQQSKLQYKTGKSIFKLLPMQRAELASKIIELLQKQSLFVSVAESFTGGGIANALIQIDGAGAVFYEGIVSYNEVAKTERLGVDTVLLKEKGAVNCEVARQMLQGLLKDNKADVGVATTGIAGSATDDFHTPIGRVYIAFGSLQEIYVHSYLLRGNRQKIMESGKVLALLKLYKYLLKREGKYE